MLLLTLVKLQYYGYVWTMGGSCFKNDQLIEPVRTIEKTLLNNSLKGFLKLLLYALDNVVKTL